MDKDKEIYNLKYEIKTLYEEIDRLHKILDGAGIKYDVEEKTNIADEIITKEHIKLFYSIFKGRKDVYSKRIVRKDGKAAYYPVCNNFWKYGICPRCEQKKTKCSKCENKSWALLTQTAIYNHLLGNKEDCSDVIGIYPMLADDKCNFLVFDFDNHNDIDENTEWIVEVNAVRKICAENKVNILVERSRSGKGAHIWMFFEEVVDAAAARKFGTALLTKGSETVNLKNFKYYDRMIPTQDHLTEGGLGNLIALPLQGQAVKKGNSVFVDENWKAYKNQWDILRGVKRISKVFIDEKINEWSKDGLFGVLSESDTAKDKPWKRSKLDNSDVDGSVEIVLANQIYINKTNLKPRIQNRIGVWRRSVILNFIKIRQWDFRFLIVQE